MRVNRANRIAKDFGPSGFSVGGGGVSDPLHATKITAAIKAIAVPGYDILFISQK